MCIYESSVEHFYLKYDTTNYQTLNIFTLNEECHVIQFIPSIWNKRLSFKIASSILINSCLKSYFGLQYLCNCSWFFRLSEENNFALTLNICLKLDKIKTSSLFIWHIFYDK